MGTVLIVNAEAAGESREGVKLTNLDQPLFDGADATKRDLIDYLDAVGQPKDTTSWDRESGTRPTA